MSDEIIVSIIVPVYNAEKYIDVCIKSLVMQTYRNIEIIIVDDCSSDRSLELCKHWSEQDERIMVFSLEENSGPSAARNSGLEHAVGDYITFVDSDDWIENDCIQVAVDTIKGSDADVVMWNLINHHGRGELLVKSLEGEKRLFTGDEIRYLQEMLLTSKSETDDSALNLTGPYCKLYHRDVLREACFPIGIDLGEDTCFVMQAFDNSSKLVYIDKSYYHWIDYSNSLSHKNDANYARRRLDYTNWMLEYCMSKGIASEKEWNAFVYMNFTSIINKCMHVVPTFAQVGLSSKINKFLTKTVFPLDLDAVEEDDERKKRYLKNGWYWRYKLHFVASNFLKKT